MSGSGDEAEGLLAEVLDAVSQIPAGRVKVSGEGSLAAALTRRLGAGEEAGEAPLAVIETTGHSDQLAAACAEVASGGTVVLAGGPAAPVDIDLYRDVHRRGLVLIGVPDPGETPGTGGADPPG
jgi:threonine dehydrogenase-like Zn-dependent dehydrogenase